MKCKLWMIGCALALAFPAGLPAADEPAMEEPADAVESADTEAAPPAANASAEAEADEDAAERRREAAAAAAEHAAEMRAAAAALAAAAEAAAAEQAASTSRDATAVLQNGQSAGQTPSPANPVATRSTEANAAGAGGPTSRAARPVDAEEPGLRLNFRNAPLDLVLDYLAEAAGFTIILDTKVEGTLDLWNNEPLTRDEAVDLLNKVLARKGYALMRDGRTLTVYEARERPPVIPTTDGPESIPPTDEVVTQIIPVTYVDAAQLVQDLQPLLPSEATTIANRGANKIVITDSRVNIRRMVEIITALDTPVSSASSIRVFQLQHADAKAVATMIRDLNQDTGNNNRGGGGNPFQQFFRGRGN